MSLPSPGTGLIGLNWVGTVIFTITAILAVVDPDTFEVDLVVDGLEDPYTYSDMTGFGLNLVVNPPAG